MQVTDNILELVNKKAAETVRSASRGLILLSGAIGDCILALPLAGFVKDSLALEAIDLAGNMEYISLFPGRTVIDRVRSIESIELHKLFAKAAEFELPDRDSLIDFFANYSWIMSFLGEPGSDFEQNLIWTANCSRSSDVISLSMKPPSKFAGHLTQYYAQQFAEQCAIPVNPARLAGEQTLIKANESDKKLSLQILQEITNDSDKVLVIIHPGSGGKEKCWHLDNFIAVARKLRTLGSEVMFLLGPAELERFTKKDLIKMSAVAKCLAELTLTEVLGILSCTALFIGNDSGITHLAAGLGVPTFAVFGPSNPIVYKPIGPKVTVLATKSQNFSSKPSPYYRRKLLALLKSFFEKHIQV
ncbi:MAG: hypothetical protein JXB29_12630 [Sedimentisphaerales bacterium]|nr:hypothetical protein [Sedimentisphaerales bacterium]